MKEHGTGYRARVANPTQVVIIFNKSINFNWMSTFAGVHGASLGSLAPYNMYVDMALSIQACGWPNA